MGEAKRWGTEQENKRNRGGILRQATRVTLKEWLDRNLPDMVEELVTREIARIAGKSL